VFPTTTHAIDSAVSDMLALEAHFAEALASQLRTVDENQALLARELSRCHRTVQDHVQALRKIRRAPEPGLSGTIAGAIKRAGAIAGALESAGIDLVRIDRLPKDLRNNFASASLATIGYVALYTTAVALEDGLVALLASRHLKDYARITMSMYHLMPGAVLDFLTDDGLPARDDVLPMIRRALDSAWESATRIAPQPA
jgi:hypothetical protein